MLLESVLVGLQDFLFRFLNGIHVEGEAQSKNNYLLTIIKKIDMFFAVFVKFVNIYIYYDSAIYLQNIGLNYGSINGVTAFFSIR